MDPALEQRIRAGYAAFARQDLDAVLAAFRPEATLTNPAYAIEGGVREGTDQLRAGLESLHEQFDFLALEVDEIDEGPGGVLVVLDIEANGRGSGAPFRGRFSHVLRLLDGEVVDLAWFSSPEEGRAAVGL
jgi:ketosteroid isomerase-like protein